MPPRHDPWFHRTWRPWPRRISFYGRSPSIKKVIERITSKSPMIIRVLYCFNTNKWCINLWYLLQVRNDSIFHAKLASFTSKRHIAQLARERVPSDHTVWPAQCCRWLFRVASGTNWQYNLQTFQMILSLLEIYLFVINGTINLFQYTFWSNTNSTVLNE